MIKMTMILFMLLFVVIEGNPSSLETCLNIDNTIESSINYVSFSMAKQIEEPGNMLFSPMGVSMAMGMAYMGARGRTAKQMEGSLGYTTFGLGWKRIHGGNRELCEDAVRRSANGEYQLIMANALFNQVGCDVTENFVKGIRTYYLGDVMSLNFTSEPQNATDTINQWSNEKTSGKIDTFLEKPVATNIAIISTNAIYFKGTWKIQFPVTDSFIGSFFVTNKNKWKRTWMMSLEKEKFRYFVDKSSGYRFIELPYKGGQVSMIIGLPIEVTQPADLDMTSNVFYRVTSKMVETKFEKITIPRFRIEYKTSMKNTLKKMGIREAFERRIADFSGMDTSNGIFLSDVIHKAVIEVTEEGTEAAAASGVFFEPLSAMRPKHPEFVANHPFLFYILDHATSAILFSGRVEDP